MTADEQPQDTSRRIVTELSGGLKRRDELVELLGDVSPDDIDEALRRMFRDGYIAGPIWAGFEGDEWRDMGYGLLGKGRDMLGT